MKRIIQIGAQRIEILRSHECDPDDTPMEFRDKFLTLDFLRRLMYDPLNMVTLRSTLSELLPVVGILRLTDDELIQQFAWQMAEGYIRLVRRIESPPRVIGGRSSSGGGGSESDSEAGQDTGSGTGSRGGSGASSEADSGASSSGAGSGAAAATETAEESTTDDETAAPEEETDWIEFRVVDDETGQPVSGVILEIRLPDGEVRDYTTDGNGIVRIEDLSSGTCDIVKITDPDAAEVVQVE